MYNVGYQGRSDKPFNRVTGKRSRTPLQKIARAKPYITGCFKRGIVLGTRHTESVSRGQRLYPPLIHPRSVIRAEKRTDWLSDRELI